MKPASLHVGTFTRSVLIDLARSSGKLAAAGLDVTETSVVSSPAQFRSLADGEYDLVLTSPDNVIAYRFLSANPLGENLPVQIVAGIDRALGLSLCVAPSVEDVERVRGKVVGVDVPQSGFAFVAFALLERAGLAPGDYVLESLGSTPRRADALIAEDCLATVLNAGNELRAQGRGCHLVSRVDDLGPYLGTVVAALETSDPAVAEVRLRFVDVLLEVADEILAGQWVPDVIESARRLLDLDEAEATAHHACLLDPVTGLVPGGIIDAAAVGTLIGLRHSYRPTDELDVGTAQWPDMVLERARERTSDSHA